MMIGICYAQSGERSDHDWTQQVDCRFNASASAHGQYVVIGDPYEDDVMTMPGRADVYRLLDDGTREHVALLRPPDYDGSPWFNFGKSVAICGNWIFVGADGASHASIHGAAVYVFQRQEHEWRFHSKLVPNDASAEKWFGLALDCHENMLVVGAPGDDANGKLSGSGAAYVFEYADGVWQQVAKLTHGKPESLAYFGVSVAANGRHIAIGSIGTGVVLFAREEENTWHEISRIEGSRRGFGAPLAFRDHLLAVGDALAPNGGCAHVYEIDGASFERIATLCPGSTRSDVAFGGIVQFRGDTLLVGCRGPWVIEYVAYRRIDDEWTEQRRHICEQAHVPPQIPPGR